MIEVRCPRCLRYWYTDEPEGGAARLCAECADELRRGRHPGEPIDRPFLLTVAGLVGVDLVLIGLAMIWPRVIGGVLVGYGGILLMLGLVGLRWTVPRGHVGETDWTLARWPLVVALAGLACVLAFVSVVVVPSRL